MEIYRGFDDSNRQAIIWLDQGCLAYKQGRWPEGQDHHVLPIEGSSRMIRLAIIQGEKGRHISTAFVASSHLHLSPSTTLPHRATTSFGREVRDAAVPKAFVLTFAAISFGHTSWHGGHSPRNATRAFEGGGQDKPRICRGFTVTSVSAERPRPVQSPHVFGPASEDLCLRRSQASPNHR